MSDRTKVAFEMAHIVDLASNLNISVGTDMESSRTVGISA